LKYKKKTGFPESCFKEFIGKKAALLLNTSSFDKILSWPAIASPL
jgi:hypothetical protein